MTLYLARKLVDGVVDETTTVYIGRCDDGDCRYLADHAASEVVEDALDGHRRRAHATSTARTTRAGTPPAPVDILPRLQAGNSNYATWETTC